MDQLELPQSLVPAFWDQRKATLAKNPKPPSIEVGDEFEKFASQCVGIDYKVPIGDKIDTAAVEAVRNAAAIAYTRSWSAWGAARDNIQSQRHKLKKAIVDNYAGNFGQPASTKAVRKRDRVLEMFDESLIDNLDKTLNSADEAGKAQWHREARALSRLPGRRLAGQRAGRQSMRADADRDAFEDAGGAAFDDRLTAKPFCRRGP